MFVYKTVSKIYLQIVRYMYVIEPGCLLLPIVDELKPFPSSNCCSLNI